MSELISGKDVVLALLEGKDLLWKKTEWEDDEKEPVCKSMWNIEELLTGKTVGGEVVEFYLKPRTITLNRIELNQCYSVAIDYTRNEVKVEFKNRNDAEALHDVISKLYGFK